MRNTSTGDNTTTTSEMSKDQVWKIRRQLSKPQTSPFIEIIRAMEINARQGGSHVVSPVVDFTDIIGLDLPAQCKWLLV